ncbi:MAG: hypothetical protein ABH827_02165 [bacterium]
MRTCKHTRQAFALITILVVSSVLMLFTLACWQRSMLCRDLVTLREQYLERFYLAETVLNIGIQLTQQNPDWLTSKQKRDLMPLKFDVTAQVLSQQITFQEKLKAQKITATTIISVPNLRTGARTKKRIKNLEQNFLIVSAQLRELDKVIMVLHCTVTTDKRENHDLQDSKVNDFSIVVDNFTVGASI